MQCTATGIYYLVNGIGSIIDLIILSEMGDYPSDTSYIIINSVGGISIMIAAMVLLKLVEKRWNLGLSKV